MENFIYNDYLLFCTPSRFNVPFTIAKLVLLSVIPSVLTGIFYRKIFTKALKIKAKLAESSNFNNKNFEFIKLAKTLYISYLLYAICW